PDGRPTIADLLEGPAVAVDTVARAAMPRFAIRRAILRAGELDLVDESRTPTYQEAFRELELELDHISTLPNEDGSHALTARITNGATITWRGEAVLDPLRLDGRFDITGARLPKLAEAFAPTLPLRLDSGELDVTLPYHVERSADGGIAATLPGVDATLRGISAQPPGASAAWVRIDAVELRGAQVRWPVREATVRAVRVRKPWLKAVRLEDGTVDWQALRTVPDSGDVPPAEGPTWSLRVDSLSVLEGTIHVEDRTATPALVLDATPLQVDLADVSTDGTRAVGLRVSTLLDGRSRVTARGSVTPAPFSAELDVAAERLDVRLAQRYLGAAPPITIASGTASISGRAKLGSGRPAASFDGQASMDGILVRDAGGDSLLAWRGMRASGIRFTSRPDLLRVRLVQLDRPFARVAISREQELNLATVAAQLLEDTTTTEPYPYEIGKVAIDRGEVDFSDESLILPFRATIDSARGTIEDVSSLSGTPGSMTIEGVVDRDGLAVARGSLHPADPFAATDVRMEFRNLDLARFTPYSAQFMGYAIRDGRLDLDLHYKVLERRLDADHHMVAKDLQLGEKVEGGESPGFLVKLAISLLKDRDGRITLDVPVTGTVDDPQFSYRGIVWTAMKQILGKIATAPFRFFGKLLGIGGDSPELVEFEPGRTDLIPPEREKLDSLAALLERKPELVLGVTGRYDPVTDAEAIREAKLHALVAQRRDSLFRRKGAPDTSGTTLGRTLESLYQSLHTEAALDSLRDSIRLAVRADTVKGRKPRRGYETPGYFETLRARLYARQTADTTELVELARARAAPIAAQLATSGLTDASRVGEAEIERVKSKREGDPRVASELRMDAK
ncbi:MAG TPA: DUF748 domain-containing protein, partial [Gemmatimonadales bacterium]|nr:DUF748 domain-containing protein [Gemmatimonadales bacterium]